MQITIALSRPTRRTAAALAVIALLVGPAVALANHQYNDVPTAHPFHSEISAITRAGVAGGFPDGGYHPSDPVTRQAMAAFLHRGLGRAALTAALVTLNPSVVVPASTGASTVTTVRDVTITVPGATNGSGPNQLVYVRADLQFDTSMHASKGCPCEFVVWIYDTVGGAASYGHIETFESTVNAAFGYGLSDQGLFAVPPGSRTFRMAVQLINRANIGPAATFELNVGSSLSATTFAFGPTGSNTTTKLNIDPSTGIPLPAGRP